MRNISDGQARYEWFAAYFEKQFHGQLHDSGKFPRRRAAAFTDLDSRDLCAGCGELGKRVTRAAPFTLPISVGFHTSVRS